MSVNLKKNHEKGDKGITSLIDKECPKDTLRVRAYGAVDEISSTLGMVVSFSEDKELREIAFNVQKKLFEIGSELAASNPKNAPFHLKKEDTKKLEELIDRLEKELPPLKNFIIPDGTTQASLFHFSRAVCRRAEREIVALAESEEVNPKIISFINRLSDLLFTLARQANFRAGHPEITCSS